MQEKNSDARVAQPRPNRRDVADDIDKDIERGRQPQPEPTSPVKATNDSSEASPDTLPSPSRSPSPSSPTAVALSRTSTAMSIPIATTLSLPSELLLVGTLCSAQLFTQASLTQVLALLHVINAALSPGDITILTPSPDLPWLIAGYSLTVGTFILPAGRLGDSLGHKRVFLFGLAWFAAWSVIVGCATLVTSPEAGRKLFITARVFQGIGPALILPNGLAILGRAYPPGSQRKAFAFSLFGACAPTGAVIGAATASVIALGWWPWAFWGFGIACAAVAALAWWVIPPCNITRKCESAAPEASLIRRLRYWVRELDIIGGVTGVTTLVLFNFAWNQAPVVGWATAEALVPLVLGLLLFSIFFYIELRISDFPLVPVGLFTGEVSFVLAAVACGWSCFGIWVYYCWQYIEVLRGISPLIASAWFCPVVVSGAAAAVCTGFILGRLRPAVVMTIALSAFTIGAVLMATVPLSQGYWGQLFVMMIIMPWGMDMSFPASTIILSDAVGRKHQGIAASLVNTVVNYSISLGLGIAGTVELHVNRGGENDDDVLRGYRGALYVGIGLAVLGLTTCVLFLVRSAIKRKRSTPVAEKSGHREGPVDTEV